MEKDRRQRYSLNSFSELITTVYKDAAKCEVYGFSDKTAFNDTFSYVSFYPAAIRIIDIFNNKKWIPVFEQFRNTDAFIRVNTKNTKRGVIKRGSNHPLLIGSNIFRFSFDLKPKEFYKSSSNNKGKAELIKYIDYRIDNLDRSSKLYKDLMDNLYTETPLCRELEVKEEVNDDSEDGYTTPLPEGI